MLFSISKYFAIVVMIELFYFAKIWYFYTHHLVSFLNELLIENLPSWKNAFVSVIVVPQTNSDLHKDLYGKLGQPQKIVIILKTKVAITLSLTQQLKAH